MARLLLIVSRAESARYTYFKHVFASTRLFTSEAVEVIVDRRLGERRQRRAPVRLERRRQERRVREGVVKDLDTFGWAVVRH